MVPSTPQDNPQKKVAFATKGPAPVRSLFPKSSSSSSHPFPPPTKERRQELWNKGEKSKHSSLPLPPSAKKKLEEVKSSKDFLKVMIDPICH